MRLIEPKEQLRTLAHDYRHVQQEHARRPPRSAMRHRFEREMQTIAERFERLLSEWVPDEGLRRSWRDYLHGRGPAPDMPSLLPPPMFKGRTEAGALIEIRPGVDGYDVLMDGARIDHSNVPWHLDVDSLEPILIGDHACEELFDAPEPAVRALADFLARRSPPPNEWMRELFEDGLIDGELALTPRGHRCIRGARVRGPRARQHNVCVLVADAVRARVYMFDADRGELVEVAELTNPMLRARDAALVSDSRPGLRREAAPGPRHAVSDHRDHRRREVQRHFAARVAEEAAGVWRRYPSCELIVAASPVMLGLLRPAIDRQLRPKDDISLHELARDLSKLTAPRLYEQLVDAALLPERAHRTAPPP